MSDPTQPPVVERFVLGPFETNCYLVRAPEAGVCWIVDAGFDVEPMLERVRETQERVEAIVLTHAHVDHIAGLEEVQRAFPEAPILVHQAEADFLQDPERNLSAALGQPLRAPAPTRPLTGGERLDLGAHAWDVLHTPGHSPGGITLVSDAAGAALVGDTLFAGSIGRHDFPTSDESALFRSIRETLYALPEETRVLPGHGPETTIGREKRSNPFVRA